MEPGWGRDKMWIIMWLNVGRYWKENIGRREKGKHRGKGYFKLEKSMFIPIGYWLPSGNRLCCSSSLCWAHPGSGEGQIWAG